MKIQRILVAKLRHHGDVLLSAPVFSCLKKIFPEAAIHAYIYQETFPILEGHPAIEKFHLYDRGKKRRGLQRIFHEISILKKIRKEKYDLVINLTEGDRGALAAFVSPCKLAVGFDPEGSGMWRKDRMYTHMIPSNPKPRHTVEKNLDALRVLGYFPKEDDRKISFHIPNSAKEKVNALTPLEYIHIHPTSRWLFKCLPTDVIASVIKDLYEQGKKVVLTGAPDHLEREMNQEIVKKAGVPVTDLTGKISLKELGAVIAKSKLCFCVDSLPLHMSSALQTPVVVAFGPSSEKTWGPWQHPQSKVIRYPISCRPCHKKGCANSGVSDCLERIRSKEILSAIYSLLPSS